MAVAWKNDRYAGAAAEVAPGLTLSVWYSLERLKAEEPHYEVSVFGNTFKDRSLTIERGKELAEVTAKAWLVMGLKVLES